MFGAFCTWQILYTDTLTTTTNDHALLCSDILSNQYFDVIFVAPWHRGRLFGAIIVVHKQPNGLPKYNLAATYRWLWAID